jgi:LPXTG-motif cell wall-anchored protein
LREGCGVATNKAAANRLLKEARQIQPDIPERDDLSPQMPVGAVIAGAVGIVILGSGLFAWRRKRK